MRVIKKPAKARAPRPLFASDYRVLLEHLRRATKASGLTQTEIARRLDRPTPYLSKALNGHQALTLIEVRAICRAADINFVGWVTELNAALEEREKQAQGH